MNRGLQLCCMGMRGAYIDPKPPRRLPSQWPTGQHADHRSADHLRRPPAQKPLGGLQFKPARVPGVPLIHLGRELGSGQANLLGVDHHHVIPAVQMRGEQRLVLASKKHRHPTGQPAQNLSLGINEMPLVDDLVRLWKKRSCSDHLKNIVYQKKAEMEEKTPSRPSPALSGPPP